MLVLSTERLCSLNLSLGRRLVSPMYSVNGSGYIVSCRLICGITGYVGSYVTGFACGEKCILFKAVSNILRCVSFAVVFGLSSSFSSLADQISCGIQRTNKQDLRSRLLQYIKFTNKTDPFN